MKVKGSAKRLMLRENEYTGDTLGAFVAVRVVALSLHYSNL